MRDTLHWLPAAQCISYRIAVLVWQSGGAFLVAPLQTLQSGVSGHRSSSLAGSWYLVLLLQLDNVAYFPFLAPPPGMDTPWRSASCLGIVKTRSASYLRLIYSAVAGLGGASEQVS